MTVKISLNTAYQNLNLHSKSPQTKEKNTNNCKFVISFTFLVFSLEDLLHILNLVNDYLIW